MKWQQAENALKNAMNNYRQLARDAQQKALEEAKQAAQLGQQQSFQTLLQTAVANAAPQAAGTHTRTNWRYEITDPAAIPREYLKVDEQKIGLVARQTKGSVTIPGVRIYPEETVVARNG